ncbi:MAG TPA: helix-hairpin-helix domain-containing protein [Candidatus Coprenecus stercoravium]|uniref:Helix-hairpin-helix domain-containing protein n=1 Tax=Candidatus Coprenecus stercoravium TaxID=2840735 RepID=A0A9D2GRK7_9BACT|nr:helix-hairpin-helix domain-containing protein [Candidatus Coprenecus stercoravium]
MWEEEKKKKGKTERLFSNGVVILVFLILAAQSVVFARYLIREHRHSGAAAAPDTAAVQNAGNYAGKDTTAPRTGPPPQKAGSGNKKTDRTADSGDGVAAGSPAAKPENQRLEYDYDGWKWDMVELNSADSAALDELPGIGPYYARQIIRYRERLGCYADISQLLDIRGIDTALLRRLADRLYIEPFSVRRLDLRTMSLDSMSAHPYIGPYAAKGIERLRRTVPDSIFSVQAILDHGIITPAQARRLSLYCD